MDPNTLKGISNGDGEDMSPMTPVNLDDITPDDEKVAEGNDSDNSSVDTSTSSVEGEGEEIVDEDASDDDEEQNDSGDIGESSDDESDVESALPEEDDDSDEEDEPSKKKVQKVVQHLESILASQPSIDVPDQDDDFEEDSDDEDYMEKFDEDIKNDVIKKYHPDLMQSNYDEISALVKVVRDEQGNIIDPIHNTIPILTKFERARVLGLRAKQINNGADPFIEVPTNVIEGHIIAQMELEQRVLPFIIVRPLPNGKKEYWRIQDLKLIDY